MERGEAPATIELQHEALLDSSAWDATVHRPGVIAGLLAAAGEAFLQPDLIQSMADKPLHEVLDFFERLRTLPAQPTEQALRHVFRWDDDGFLPGINYEVDPVGAWVECALTCCSLA